MIIKCIAQEFLLAEKKFPGWPEDIVHGSAIIQEECGELVKATLDFFYKRGTIKEVRKEALQTGAMIYRFLMHLEDYKPGGEE